MIVGILSSLLLGFSIMAFIMGKFTLGIIGIVAIVALFVGGFLFHLFRG